MQGIEFHWFNHVGLGILHAAVAFVIAFRSILIISFVLLLSIGLYFGFQRLRLKRQTKSHDKFKGLLVGHRGARVDGIPENSLASFEYGISRGAELIEVDVLLTADGHVVVCHDDWVENFFQGSGFISDMTLEEVKALQYKEAKDNKELETLRIPTLEEAIECIVKKHGRKIMIETKGGIPSQTRILTERTVQIIEDFEAQDSVMLISFDPYSLYIARSLSPELMTCFLYQRGTLGYSVKSGVYKNPMMFIYGYIVLDFLLYHLGSTILPALVGASFVGPKLDLVKPELIQYWYSKGIGTYVWVVNNSHQKKYLMKLGACVGTDWYE